MGKKVVIISSSPRKGGNSDTLSDSFASGAAESNHSVEKIFLKNYKINYCAGCGRCYDERNGCSQHDDMGEILQKLVDADVVVMATPVYFFTMCGQMKTFIDRTCARYSELNNKEFYFILTAGTESKPALERTVEEFRAFTSCLESPHEKGILYGVNTWRMGDAKKTGDIGKAFEMGKNV